MTFPKSDREGDMTRLAPLSFAAHGGLGWIPTVSSLESDGTAAASISMDEVPAFAVRFPLAIKVRGGRALPVVPVSLLSCAGMPILDETGVWRPRIVPFALRRGPFQSVRTGRNGAAFVDETHLLPAGGQVVPLFEGSGGLSAATGNHLSALAGWQAGMKRAERAATALYKARLLVPWRDDHTTLFAPDADALVGMAGRQLSQMHQADALRLAHMIELSQALIDASPPSPNDKPLAGETGDGDAFLRALREEMS